MSQIKKDLSELIQSVGTLATELNTLTQTIDKSAAATETSAKSTRELTLKEKLAINTVRGRIRVENELDKELRKVYQKRRELLTQDGQVTQKSILFAREQIRQKKEELSQEVKLHIAKAKAIQLKERGVSALDLELAKIRQLNSEHRKQADTVVRNANATNTLTQSKKRLTQSTAAASQMMGQFRGMLISTFGAYAIINAIKTTVKTIAEFEAAMARVAAITGATGEEIKTLSNLARNVSMRGSIFDPKTIAELQIELSKLGFTVREISLTTKPIINLATAMGEDLARAAEVAAATLRSFNLDAGQMEDVIDVMGKTFSTSAMDMARWAEGAKYAAPVANTLGWSVRDLAATMGVLANRQIFGSLAGTSLRNIMSAIADESSDLNKALGGNIKSFDDFVDRLIELNEGGVAFGDVLNMIEKRSTTALTIMIKNAEELKGYRDGLEDVNGAIENMANVQLTTLTAETKKLSAAWKAFVTSADDGAGAISTALKAIIRNASNVVKSIAAINQYGPAALYWWIDQEQRIETVNAVLDRQNREYREHLKNLDEEQRKAAVNDELERRIRERTISQGRYNLALERQKELEQEIANLAGEIPDASRKRVSEIKATLGELKSELQKTQKEVFINDGVIDEYGNYVNTVFSQVTKDLKELSVEQLKELETELTNSVNDYINKVEDGFVFDFPDIAAGQFEAEQMKLDAIYKIIDARVKARESDDKKAKKDELNRLKSHLAAMRALEIDKANADQEYSDQQREEELERIRQKYDTEGFLLEAKFTDDAKLRDIYYQRAEVGLELHEAIKENIRGKYNEIELKERKKNSDRLLAETRRTYKIEEELLKMQIAALKRELQSVNKDDKAQVRSLTELIFGAEYELEVFQIENEMRNIADKILAIQSELDAALTDDDKSLVMSAWGITDEQMDELLSQYSLLQIKLFDRISEGVQKFKDEQKTLADVLKIDPRDLAVIMQGLNAISDAFRGAADAAVEAANAKVDASNRAIAELQRDLEIEMGLAEQGFASNVSLKRKMLEEEKRIRDKNIEDQKKAQKEQLLLQTTLDAANLVSTVIQIALHSTKTQGLAGLIAAGVGLAGVFALYKSVQAKSKQITSTKYEKGGHEILQGKSHRQGGISLGEGREAEGGEMFSVFNKKATRKYGKQIAKFTDLINKDNLNLDMDAVLSASKAQNVIVNMDDRKLTEIHSVLKEMRDNDTFYANGYKIIKQGGRIRKIKNV